MDRTLQHDTGTMANILTTQRKMQPKLLAFDSEILLLPHLLNHPTPVVVLVQVGHVEHPRMSRMTQTRLEPAKFSMDEVRLTDCDGAEVFWRA